MTLNYGYSFPFICLFFLYYVNILKSNDIEVNYYVKLARNGKKVPFYKYSTLAAAARRR
jgi:hypothetical protein